MGHLYPYLKATTATFGGSSTTWAFCVTEEVARVSPRREHNLLFLAVALMGSIGIHAKFTTDPSYEVVGGSLVAPNQEVGLAVGGRRQGEHGRFSGRAPGKAGCSCYKVR